MAPGVAGHQQAFDPYAVDVQDLAVPEQHPLILRLYQGELVEPVDDPPPHFAGEVPVLDLPDVDRGVPKELLAVGLESPHVIRVLMGDEDVPDGLGVHVQPPHLLLQPPVVVARVDHHRDAVLRVEEDVGHPLPHAGHPLIDPPRVQGLEDGLAAKQQAHGLLLLFRILPCHMLLL